MYGKVSLAEKFAAFSDHWNPRIVGVVNDCHVKLFKLKGEFVWHSHTSEDEMFLVVSGRLEMRFREHSVAIDPGEFIIVPKGVEHCPEALEETQVLLFELGTVINTGDAVDDRRRAELERI
jgi:mannose-6-phosphate isomerase-like protein (cupin superfamily)